MSWGWLCGFLPHRNRVLSYNETHWLYGCIRCKKSCWYELLQFDYWLLNDHGVKLVEEIEALGWTRPEPETQRVARVFHPVVRSR